MANNVVIKIIDTVNSLDFEVPIESGSNNALSIDKELTDINNITAKGGVQSREFEVPLSKDISKNFDFFSQSQHYNYKDVDADKQAVILINGNVFERGKIRVIDFSNRNGFEYVKLLFFGNNYTWTELVKNMTMADINWTVNTFLLTNATIINTWSNTVTNGDEVVFPLESRGGRRQTGAAHAEDFRPAVFFHSLLTRVLQNVGYTLDSASLNSSTGKALVLSFFGKRFRNTEANMLLNSARLESTGFTQDSDLRTGNNLANINVGFHRQVELSDLSSSDTVGITYVAVTDPSSAFTIGQTKFTAPVAGNYKCKVDFFHIAQSNSTTTPFNMTVYLEHRDSANALIGNYTGYNMPNAFIGGCSGAFTTDIQTKTLKGEIVIRLGVGETVVIKKQIENFTTGVSWNNALITHDSFNSSFELEKKIIEGNSFDLQDVLDDNIKVLDIINDASRLLNLVFDTDEGLKKVRIETRDNFYSDISVAKDFTNRIDVSKNIKTKYNSSKYKRDMVFGFAEDSSDVFVKEMNKDNGITLGEYSHALPSKFKEGVTTIKTSVLSASSWVRDESVVGLLEFAEAPYTTRYWNEFISESPGTMLEDHKPRLLNYRFGLQYKDGNTSNQLSFRLNGEVTNRTSIPYVLPHQIDVNGFTAASAQSNLHFNNTHNQDGQYSLRWGKTVTEIINGTNINVYIYFNQKQWNDFNFKTPIYINEPIDIKGYWLLEKISNYQPENTDVVQCKLLKRVNYDSAAPIVVSVPETPANGTFRLATPTTTQPQLDSSSSSLTTQMEFTDADGNTITTDMQATNLDGTTSNMII